MSFTQTLCQRHKTDNVQNQHTNDETTNDETTKNKTQTTQITNITQIQQQHK